jgi:hypothetical protein
LELLDGYQSKGKTMDIHIDDPNLENQIIELAKSKNMTPDDYVRSLLVDPEKKDREDALEDKCVCETTTCNKLSELLDWSISFQIEIDVIDAKDRTYYFRGQADSKWGLMPSVFRPNIVPYQKIIKQIEALLLKKFQREATGFLNNCPPHDNYLQWMTLAQHHGVPTRLLDWSTSVLVAAFFAVDPDTHLNEDAAIWALSCHSLFKAPPTNSDAWALKLAKEAFYDKKQNYYSNKKKDPFSYFTPQIIDKRMQAQKSVFTIHPQESFIDVTNAESKILLKRALIRKNALEEFRLQLRLVGITHSTVFPDIDGLGKELKYEYLS